MAPGALIINKPLALNAVALHVILHVALFFASSDLTNIEQLTTTEPSMWCHM